MSVERPAYLVVALACAVAFAFLYRTLARRRTASDLAYSNVAFFEEAVRPRRWILRALEFGWLAGVVLLVASLAGVHLTLPVPVRDGSVFICIDTSGSMASTDVEPTRADAAKAAARAFIAQTPPGTKIGIIAFSGSAAVVSPLEADHAEVAAALDDVPPPNGATAIGDALALAAQHLPPRGHRVVILITDGVNNAGADPMDVARALGAQHVPVYTVGIGTPAGGLIPGTDEEATIDEDALRAYADVSGGAYARAENAGQLRDALAHLGSVTSLERKSVDASSGLAIAAGIAMIAAFLFGFGWGKFA